MAETYTNGTVDFQRNSRRYVSEDKILYPSFCSQLLERTEIYVLVPMRMRLCMNACKVCTYARIHAYTLLSIYIRILTYTSIARKRLVKHIPA
jgi:hypothetical protein